jgi:hypothetical protein
VTDATPITGPMRGRETDIGTAAEHIVCADLILHGYRAFMTAQGLPYDVICDINGVLIRIAVKSTQKPKPRPAREGSRVCYQFAVTRSKRLSTGKTHCRPYSTSDVDVVALVALDIRRVCYVPMASCRTSMHIDAPGHIRGQNKFGPKKPHQRKCFDKLSLGEALSFMSTP